MWERSRDFLCSRGDELSAAEHEKNASWAELGRKSFSFTNGGSRRLSPVAVAANKVVCVPGEQTMLWLQPPSRQAAWYIVMRWIGILIGPKV